MDTLVDGALSWAPLAAGDLPALCELRDIIDYFDDPVDQPGSDALRERFDRCETAADDAVVGRDMGGTIVAYGWNVVHRPDAACPQIWLDGGVHPAERHHHIGTHLVQWQLARAEEWAQQHRGSAPLTTWVGTHVDERVGGRSMVMRRCGLAPERWYLDLRCDLDAHDDPSDDAFAPTCLQTRMGSLDILPFDPTQHSEDVRALHNEVFGRLGAEPVGVREWERSLQRSEAQSTCSWVARSADGIVGYALNACYTSPDDQVREGWTDRLGVAHAWRGEGVATALLAASKHCFAQSGFTSAGVGLDTRDPEHTLGAFHRAGYQPSETVALWSRELTVGRDGGASWVAPGHLG